MKQKGNYKTYLGTISPEVDAKGINVFFADHINNSPLAELMRNNVIVHACLTNYLYGKCSFLDALTSAVVHLAKANAVYLEELMRVAQRMPGPIVVKES
jgi:signal-transduction protein with cAMP-binding, CBS, and nucleotidyltransferase domain